MKHVVATSLLLLSALAMMSCGKSTPSAVEAVSAASLEATTSTVAVEESFIASGPLIVENQVDVAAQREGIVASIHAEPGMHVKRGQLLANLDDRQMLADLEAARAKTRSIDADLKNWEAEAKVLDADFQRAQKMWDAGLITKEQYDHAKYKAESDQWDVKRVGETLVNSQQTQKSLELESEKTRIRAPFDGIVARRYVRAGQKVAVGDRLFWVTAEGPLRVKFTLPEKYLARLQKGQTVVVSTANVQGEKRRAKVIEVSPVVDPSSDTIEVLAELMGRAGDLRPGMTANISLESAR